MRRRLPALWLLLCPLPAAATGPLVPAESGSEGLDFSLYFASAEAPLDYAGRRQDSRTRRIGISLREQVSRRVTLGMHGGYAWLTQTGNPLTAGVELDGFHAGLSVHGVLLEGKHALLFGALDYLYQKTDHKTDTQTVVIDWAEPQARLGALLTPAPALRLYGGVSYGKLEGEERASGTVNHTLAFERGARAGGFIGLDLNVDAGGYIGIEARSGATRYMEIYFKHRY